MNLPDFILLEQTGKDKRLPLFTCHTSLGTLRTDNAVVWKTRGPRVGLGEHRVLSAGNM